LSALLTDFYFLD
jgi:hypothetical protein